MITVQTNHPVAYDSPDHIHPYGTKNDNYTSPEFIDEIENYFDQYHGLDKIHFMDLGCAGGQLVIDFHDRGHVSVGLEGSDYNAIHRPKNWAQYHNTNLFTCDITKPYSVFLDDDQIQFHLITAWEVVEHISHEDLPLLFEYIDNNLVNGGMFVASVATHEDVINGMRLHQSVHTEEVWNNEIFPFVLENTSLDLRPYPFTHCVRGGDMSFHILLKKNETT